MTNVIPFHSHLMTTSVIANMLVERGHNVTLITIKATQPHPNLTVVNIEDVFRLPPNFSSKVAKFSPFEFAKFQMDRGADTPDELLSTPVFQQLMNVGTPDFQVKEGLPIYNVTPDVLIAESHFMQEIYSAFAEKFNIPLITYQPILTPPHVAHIIGNYYNPAFMAEHKLGYTSRMSFWQRLENSLLSLGEILYQNFIYLPRLDTIMRKHFAKFNADKWPYFKEIIRARNGFTLVDTHHAITDPKPNNPNVLEMGGIHIKPTKPLPKDIEDFLNGSPHGVIYFAMGTFMDGKNLTPQKRANLLKLFSNLKQRVIWKIDPSLLDEKQLPANVQIGKWFPQNDILAHPKCILFMTHGGIHSLLESVYHGVPMMGIPVFADQVQNMRGVQEKGMGEWISFELEYEELKRNVDKVLTDQRYTQRVRQYAQIYRSELPDIVNKVMYYIEYVVRHNGAPHLRTAALKLEWYQYFNLDVFIVFFLGLGGSVYLLYKSFI